MKNMDLVMQKKNVDITDIEILYVYFDKYTYFARRAEFSLSSRYRISYKKSRKTAGSLTINKNPLFIENFWGKNISECTVMVGENGSGKTTFFKTLIDYLMFFEYGNYHQSTEKMLDNGSPQKYINDFFFIFRRKDSCGNWHVDISGSSCYQNMILSDKSDRDIQIEYHDIGEYGLGRNFNACYVSNALDSDDFYRNKIGFVNDLSLGGMIRFFSRESREHGYTSIEDDSLRLFFVEQYKQILSFYDKADEKYVDFEIPFISEVRFSFADLYTIEEKLQQQIESFIKLKRRKFCRNGMESLIDESKDDLSWMDDDLSNAWSKVRYARNYVINELKYKKEAEWKKQIYTALLINITCCLCGVFDPTKSDGKADRMISYFRCLGEYPNRLKKSNDIVNFTGLIDALINYSLSEGRVVFDIYSDFLKTIKEFILWIEKYKENGESVSIRYNRIIVPLTKEKKEGKKRVNVDFTHKLLDYYRKTGSYFPYLQTDMNLSAGEFNYLCLFSRLHSLGKNNEFPRNLLLIFDEAELGFHPEWQREYVDRLTRFLKLKFDKEIKIQVLISTNSPILLSDFPSENVLYLPGMEGRKYTKYNVKKRNDVHTFGGEIGDLYWNSFFLRKGTIGEFARKKINDYAKKIEKGEITSQDSDELERLIKSIGNIFLRNSLMLMKENDKD